MVNDYSILIGGEAGQGSRRAGLIIGKLFSELGYRIFIYDDYQSLIRGGHNFSQIRASNQEVLSSRRKIDFLLALDKNTFNQHQKDLDKNGIVIYDDEKVSFSTRFTKDRKMRFVGLPLKTIVQQAGGAPIMENIALVAGFAKVIGVGWPVLARILKKEFKKWPDLNLKVAETGFKGAPKLVRLRKGTNRKSLTLLTGNQAVCLGAVKAGLIFYFAYPMTPATGILHYFAKKEKEFGVKTIQMENEIGVINAALGAAYAGARTMVGTSGGGFALMTEALSLAVQSEIPMLIVESQRTGPATGVPTYTAQGDLSFVLSAGHGDILKFVIAPGDARQAYFWAGKSLNLAWQCQTPVVLLIDKQVSESTFDFDFGVLNKIKIEKPLIWDRKGEYQRYQNTKNGISPLAFPGDKRAVVKATSYEHDEFGLGVEDEKNVALMQNKRLRKFELMKRQTECLPAVEVYGKKNSSKAVIVWGSTVGPAREAAVQMGFKVIQPVIIQPWPEKQIRRALKGVKRTVLVEASATGQLADVLDRYSIKIDPHTKNPGVGVDRKVLKYDGRPFLPEEIKEKLDSI